MNEHQKRRARRISGAVEAEIRRLAMETNYSPAQIHEQLGGKGKAPDPRTIRGIVNEERPPIPSLADAWSPMSGDAIDATLVIPVLQAAIERTEGKRWQLTNDQAAWIAKVRSVAQDLQPLWSAYLLANAYAGAARRGFPTGSLDVLVSFAPWRGSVERDRYWRAVKAGAPSLPFPTAVAIVPDLFKSPEAPLHIAPTGKEKWQIGGQARRGAKAPKREAKRGKKRTR